MTKTATVCYYISASGYSPIEYVYGIQCSLTYTLPRGLHYSDVMMTTIAPQITSLTIGYSTVYSDADQRKHQSSASLAFVERIHRRPVNSPHKWPVTRQIFPFDDVITILSESITQRVAQTKVTFACLYGNELEVTKHRLALKTLRVSYALLYKTQKS